MGNEKYVNYYIEVLTTTLNDCVIRNLSMQANAKITDDVIAEQTEKIEKLSETLKQNEEVIKRLRENQVTNENNIINDFKNKVAEKTSLILTMPEDHAGGLHQVLSVFAWRKMNLTKIESRTLKTGLGNYFFFINIDGSWESILYKNSIAELESIEVKVKFLGHYEEYLLES